MNQEKADVLSTEQCATTLTVKPGTLRRAYCVNGHYLGLRPVKLPNGRLLWPTVEVKKIIEEAAR